MESIMDKPIDDDLWKLRCLLVKDAAQNLTKDEVASFTCAVDVGIKCLGTFRDLSANVDRIAKAQEEIASSLKDIAMHFNQKRLHD
jgi:hypothetical protein